MATITRHDSGRVPDWDFWRHMPEVELWQACALSVGFDPDKVEFSRDGWMAGPGDNGPFIESDCFRNAEQELTFKKRLRLLKANFHNRDHFSAGTLNMSASHRCGVKLSEFATWAVCIAMEVPGELAALATPLAQDARPSAPTETSAERCAKMLCWLREEEARQPRGALTRVAKRDGRARQTVSADIAKAREVEAASAGPIAAMARIVRRN